MTNAFAKYTKGLGWQGDNGITITGGNQGDHDSVNLILDIGDRIDADIKKYKIVFTGYAKTAHGSYPLKRFSPVLTIENDRITYPIPREITKHAVTYHCYLMSADDNVKNKKVVSDVFHFIIKPTPAFEKKVTNESC